jgi:hypothetical protein
VDSEEKALCNSKDSKYCGSLSRMIDSSVLNIFAAFFQNSCRYGLS